MAQLGVRLEESSKGGFMVYHNSELSLVVDVKSKQHINPLLMDSMESVLQMNNESFFQGEHGILTYQGRLFVRMLRI